MQTQHEIYIEFKELGKDDPEYLTALEKSYQQGKVLLVGPKPWHEDQERIKSIEDWERRHREEVKRLGYDPDKPVLAKPTEEILKAFDVRFTQGILELRQKYPMRDDLQREIAKMGQGLDEELYKNHDLRAKDVYRKSHKNPDNQPAIRARRKSYTNRAYRYIKTLKSNNSPVAKMIKKVDAGGLATENMLAELIYGDMEKFRATGLDIRNMDWWHLKADTLDTLDVIASKITQLYVEDVKRTGLTRTREEFTEEELQALIAPGGEPCFVIVSNEEHKRFLGKTRLMSRKAVERQVRSVKELSFGGYLSFPTTDHGTVTLWAGDSFAGIIIPEKESDWDWVRDYPQFRSQAQKLENGGGYIINFIGHAWGMLYFLNVINRNVRILPKRFYSLRAEAKLLFRLTLTQPRGRVTLSQITLINGWRRRKVTDRQDRFRLEKIQKDWKELKDGGFIKSIPKPVEEEGDLTWHYEHILGWDEPRAVIPTTCR